MRRSLLVMTFAVAEAAGVLFFARDLGARVNPAGDAASDARSDVAGEAGSNGCSIIVSGAMSATLPCRVTYLSRMVTIGILADGGRIRAPASTPRVLVESERSRMPRATLAFVVDGQPHVGQKSQVGVIAFAAMSTLAMWSLSTSCAVDGGPCAVDLSGVSTTSAADGGVVHEWHGRFTATLSDRKTDAGPVTLTGVF